mgnify:CR=1 FL=1
MNSTNFILGVSLISVAVAAILMAVPLLHRKVKMNKLYGVRFKKSFESENNWYKINEYGARQLILWSIPLAIIGVVTFFLPLKENGIVTIVVAFAPLILVIPAITSWLYTKKI